MKKIIDGDPTPYPATNTAEINAVRKFVEIIEVDRVKPDVKFLDKIPNTDGTVEIVNESQIPLGKMDVQIKNLQKKNYDRPKYQCKKDFLAACEQSILPVLLIIVNVDKSVAYWHHIDRPTLIELSKKLKKETVNLDFKKENVIQKDNAKYIDEWIKIIQDYQKKLFDYDMIEERSKKLEVELQELKKITNTAIGKTSPIFKEIHIFLDFYNDLLDKDFFTIKSILYPNYWKIGLGIYQYSENSVNYSLYPVSYDLNDVLIKQYNSEDEFYLQQVLKIVGYNYENPIKKKPKSYAYKLIEDNTNTILNNQKFLVKDQFLAKEYILAFIDKFHAILGLNISDSEYLISEIEYSLNTFLPLWIEQKIDKSEYKDRTDPSLFVIDYIFFRTFPNEIKRVSEQVKRLIKKGTVPTLNLKIRSNDFNIQILLNLIAYARQMGVDKIKREYETRHHVNKTSYYTWEAWGEEKTIKNVKVFYDNFIRIYDSLIQTYFPILISELQFFNTFNLVIIILDFTDIANRYSPSIEYYYLKSNSNVRPKIIIYNSNDTNIPLRRDNLRHYYKSELIFENNSYKYVYAQFSVLDFIYDETPILDSINKLMKERLKEYFANKKNEM